MNNSTKVCKKEIPIWLIVLDNVPTVILFCLGIILMIQLNIISGVIYSIYILVSIAWFWARICPYCESFGTRNCPCGYGIISARIFKKRSGEDFKNIFKKNIFILFSLWVVPPFTGIYLLVSKFSMITFVYLFIFCLTGLFIIPFISKIAGCKNCSIKDDCPWMKKN